MIGAGGVGDGLERARGSMRYRSTVGLCLALAACAGRSTIGGGTGTERGGGSAGQTVVDGNSNSGAASVAPPAVETCGFVPCGAGESCCLATLKCFDAVAHPEACAVPPESDRQGSRGASWSGPPCASNAHCAADQVCQPDLELCAGPGHCRTMISCGGCEGDTIACRVCGCDGRTYSRQADACFARTTFNYWSVGCGDSVGYDVTVCGSDADCPVEGDACCAVTTRCYPKSDPGQCAIPPPGTSYPCTSNAQCPDYQYCAGAGCGTPGGCADSLTTGAEGCGELVDPVCGCDGVSYTSAPCAAKAGTRVASHGECP
jgi:hypothetical protein